MSLKYITTREGSQVIDSSKAILNGLGDDGGLYLPTEIPEVSLADISDLVDASYQDKAKFVLKKFLNDFTDEEIDYCVSNAYNSNTFTDANITPLHVLNNKSAVLELYHGPTSAFKDVALQILPYLLTTSAKKNNDNRTYVILVATSGDTGKAALEGFKDVPDTKIMVFYPNDGVSLVQKLQMITQLGENVKVVAVDGNFDDTQTGVKKLFGDLDLISDLETKNHTFSSANYINWGRLVPQIVYYFASYCDLVKAGKITLGERINFTVPTGNFGNILAGYYAKMMGLPVNRLICAANANDVLKDFINTGVYNRQRHFYKTVSPSMDILISSNLERLLFILSDDDKELISSLMSSLKSSGEYRVSDELLAKVQSVFSANSADDLDTVETIKRVFIDYDYLIDTHTAVAYKVYEKYLESTGDNSFNVIVSTASPYKFSGAVAEAIIDNYSDFSELDLLEEIHSVSGVHIPKGLYRLEKRTVRFDESITKDNMERSLRDYLNL